MRTSKSELTPAGRRRLLGRRARIAAFALFTAFATLPSTGAGQSPRDAQPAPLTLEEQVRALPPHTLVQVRVHNKGLRGRVRIANHKGFILDFAADGKEKKKKISYGDVQSMQTIDGKESFSIHFSIDAGSGNSVDVQIDH